VATVAIALGVAVGFAITRAKGHHTAKPTPTPPPAQTVAAAVPEGPALPPPPDLPPEPSAIPAASASAAPTASAMASAAPTATAVASAEPTASPSAEPAAAVETGSATALRDEALELLKRMKDPEAMSKARAALDADPKDAMPYLVLGSALQDMGQWKEANRTYQICAKVATKGMVEECHAMLRRK
jgi:hypothetical protein